MQGEEQADEPQHFEAVLGELSQAAHDARRAKGRLFLGAVKRVEELGVLEVFQVHLGRLALHDAAHVILHALALAFGHEGGGGAGKGGQERHQSRQRDPKERVMPGLGARGAARRGGQSQVNRIHDGLEQKHAQHRQNRAQSHDHQRGHHPTRPAAPHQSHGAAQLAQRAQTLKKFVFHGKSGAQVRSKCGQ